MVHLTELSDEDCWALVGEPHLGRLGWNGSAGPVVLPVNYVVLDGSIWIRTGAHSTIASEVDEMRVALEVDDIDPETHVGWSVLVRGQAEIVYHEEQVPDVVLTHRAWPTGARPLWVQLKVDKVTGRRLEA